jgi:hypothetical protein
MIKDLTHKIERLELFEEKLGVVLQGISVFEENCKLTICGELISAIGTNLKYNITVIVAVYDLKDRVITHDERYFYANDFLGLETFEVSIFDVNDDNISKIRVYCKKS